VDDRAPGLLRPVIQRQAGAPNGQSVRRLADPSYRYGYQMANQAGPVRNCITRGSDAPGQALDSASRGAMMGPPMTLGYENVGRDPCAGCGESTAVGTVRSLIDERCRTALACAPPATRWLPLTTAASG
jgi:hypothetical protein